jgi:glycosyltransferase involved in cell wall biosynthesis
MHTSLPPFFVVIPARDEAATVGDLTLQILCLYSCRVIVVDDASTDGTTEAAARAGAEVLRLGKRRGAWGALRAGFGIVLRDGGELAVSFDADGQHLPASIGPLVARLAAGGPDVAVGSCPSRAGPLKRFAWAALRALSGCRVRDLTSGLRAYNAGAMRALLEPDAADLEYQDVGVLLKLLDRGLRVEEAPVSMAIRLHGRSRTFPNVVSIGTHFVKSCLHCLARRARRSGRRG